MKIALVAVVCVLALTACTPTGGPSSAPTSTTPTVEPTETVSPTPTATPTMVAAQPTLPELVLSPEGVGPVVMDQAIDPSTNVVVWDETMCDFDGGGDHAGWKPNYPFTADGKYSFLPVADGNVQSGVITYISVQSDEIRTAKGIGLGSTLDQLTAAYPGDLVGIDTDEQFHAHVLPGDAAGLYFWTDDSLTVIAIDVRTSTVGSDFIYEVTGCA